MPQHEKTWNAIFVILIGTILWGAYAIQYIENEKPCCLCLLQRLGMIGMATGALMNIKFGIRPRHYGLALFCATFGGFVALRQVALHVCPGYPPFGKPFMGLGLYTWSFITFSCSIAFIALMQMIFDHREQEKPPLRLRGWFIFPFVYLFLVAFLNIITTLVQCGLGCCE